MADEAEGHSTILLAHTRIFTRLILILTKAHDFEAMGSVIDAQSLLLIFLVLIEDKVI